MARMKAGSMAALLAIVGLAVAAGPAMARNWVAVGMVHIPVRAYASAAAPVVEVLPGGSNINLTGQCTRSLDLRQISYMSGFRQRLIVASRWCEIAGPVHGWLFGGFMKPF
jgi:uncharacterized protein YraI